jgi:hypothetical protein
MRLIECFPRFVIHAALIASLLSCFPGESHAQLQQGTIAGTLTAPDGSPVSDAVVTLLDSLGEPLATAQASAGRFQFPAVPLGTYSLRAEAPPLRAFVETLTVRDALPIQLELRLSAVAADQVVVRADERDPLAITTGVTLAGETLRRAPVRQRSRALQDAIATTPGWSTEDNGLLHVRGVDDGFLYVIDGVPVYERLDGLFGMAPDPSMIDSVHVVTGYVPAEFGFKSGGVIEVRSAGRTADAWAGSSDIGVGSDDARDFSAVIGGPAGPTALTLGAAGQASSRFLDPVHPDNLHNDGSAFSGGGQLGWTLSPGSLLTVVAGVGRSTFDVPHGEEQERAGQDQRQRIGNAWQTASWQRVWNAATVSQVAGYHRYGSSTLFASPLDTPLRTEADRTLRRSGILASISHQRGRHLFKAGGEAARLQLDESFSFAVTDEDLAAENDLSEAALAFTIDAPFHFADRATSALFGFYVQDSIRASDRLSVDIGLRADWSRLLAHASQVSPRAGVSYYVPSTATTLRASVARFFQPPQPENLLLASSEDARALSPFAEDGSAGGADVLPERQTAFDASISQTLGGRLRVDVAYWTRRVREAADPNVLFGTTIVFPNSVAEGRASGVDVRVEVPRRAGWSGYLSYANAHVVQFGPITGGLFLEDEIADIGVGTRFTPDHDQRHVGAYGVSFDRVASGTSWLVSGRYESGTPLEVGDEEVDELEERPGAEHADFERGRVRPRHVVDLTMTQRVFHRARVDLDLRAAVLNLTGDRWAYNFGNPFSGTHFGPGRTLQVRLRASLR